MNTYAPPVSELVKLGRPDLRAEPLEYQSLGVCSEHIPELIRLLQDKELAWTKEETPSAYCQVHAWRALGQLRAEAAIEPLLDLLANQEGDDWNEWVTEEVPGVLGLIGHAVIAPILARLNQRRPGQQASKYLATTLAKVATHHPELRTDVVGHLTGLLQGEQMTHDHELNAFVISDLLDLKAIEAWPSIEAAFAADVVDEFIVGSVADVKWGLGLGPEPRKSHTRMGWVSNRDRDTYADMGTVSNPTSALPGDRVSGMTPKERADARAKQRKAEKKKKKRK